MTIALVSIVIQHERRIRLAFSEALAAGAYTTLGLYGCTSADGSEPNPGVEGLLMVANSPNVVELALGGDLQGGARYLVTAVGVPGVDSTVTPGGTRDVIRFGQQPDQPNVEVPADDLGALLYGSDLVHDGTDFLETPDGDLAEMSGEQNAISAVRRRLTGGPLPWDPNYSPRLRDFVDAPNASAAAARGAIIRQAYLDDRVKKADVSVSIDDTTPDRVFYDAEVTLIGGGDPIPVDLTVPAK